MSLYTIIQKAETAEFSFPLDMQRRVRGTEEEAERTLGWLEK
jgi:hypothetical protein